MVLNSGSSPSPPVCESTTSATIEDLLTEINDFGWCVYQICQAESFRQDCWQVTLREITKSPTAKISYAQAADLLTALSIAIDKIDSAESIPKPSISFSTEPTQSAQISAIFSKFKPEPIKRRI